MKTKKAYMKDPKLEEFISVKEEILNNLANIKMTLVDCTNDGLYDSQDELYNQISDLISQTEAADEKAALELSIIKARDFEAIIDSWLSSQGRTSFELTWPDISSI
jgi:hypothetical protein